MVSSVHYRFRSNKEYSQVYFESSGIPLWELKYEITSRRRMGSRDFDLLFYDAETEEQIEDEYTNIPRNSYIIVHRIPLWMSKNAMQALQRKAEQTQSKRQMKEPPENYVCFRCGNKGHFIQHCPTNSDRSYDIVKVRKPSGIPKDFLEKVTDEGDGANSMLATEDGFVKAKPQRQEWMKHGIAIRGLEAIPQALKCSSCAGLLSRPVITNCGHHFCERCIHTGSKCIVCSKSVTRVNYDSKMSLKVDQFLGK
ncbi:hypothetical protein PAEPH01_1494 [Pancytospora epiphaga]|nr:hypothetical protein PAEPH01_1494 [Pancytospora epiphaga]